MVHAYNGILFGFKKEGNPAIWNNMDKPGGHYVKWNKPVTQGQILYQSTYMEYLEESNSWKQRVECWLPGKLWSCCSKI